MSVCVYLCSVLSTASDEHVTASTSNHLTNFTALHPHKTKENDKRKSKRVNLKKKKNSDQNLHVRGCIQNFPD
jgi:AMMECR1 domain-containing protein